MAEPGRFAGKRAVVTGAASGIGTHLVVDGGLTVGTRDSWDPDMPAPLAALAAFR